MSAKRTEAKSPEARRIGKSTLPGKAGFAPVPTSAPAPLWPTKLPKSVREVRNTAWAFGVVTQFLELATLFFIPWSEPRRWLRDPDWLWPWLVAFVGSLAWAWWLMVTCASDPGYLSPGAAGAEDEPVPEEPPPGPAEEKEDGEEQAPATTSAVDVPLHWCQRCNFMQPRRTKHCKECGLCVRKYDHHCFWIGGCVGEFNHRHFFVMLTVCTAVLLWHLRLLATCGYRRAVDPITWLFRSWWVVLMILCVFGHLLIIGCLFVYHAYLIVTAQTTWEHLCRNDIDYLRAFPRDVLPFSHGSIVKNTRAFFRRGRGSLPQEWTFTWRPGQPIPFNIFENEYWSCL